MLRNDFQAPILARQTADELQHSTGFTQQRTLPECLQSLTHRFTLFHRALQGSAGFATDIMPELLAHLTGASFHLGSSLRQRLPQTLQTRQHLQPFDMLQRAP